MSNVAVSCTLRLQLRAISTNETLYKRAACGPQKLNPKKVLEEAEMSLQSTRGKSNIEMVLNKINTQVRTKCFIIKIKNLCIKALQSKKLYLHWMIQDPTEHHRKSGHSNSYTGEGISHLVTSTSTGMTHLQGQGREGDSRHLPAHKLDWQR